MTFLKIKDPKKSDLIVEEFLKTKKNIKDNFLRAISVRGEVKSPYPNKITLCLTSTVAAMVTVRVVHYFDYTNTDSYLSIKINPSTSPELVFRITILQLLLRFHH